MTDPEPHADPRASGLPYPPAAPMKRADLPDRGPGAPASWGLRATARIIDFIIVLMPATLLAEVFGVERNAEGTLVGPFWPRLIFPAVFIAYETILVARSGQTLGKLLCRIKVVEWSTGELPTPREAFLRAIVPGIWFFLALLGGTFGLLIFLPVLVYLTSIADTLYRGVHDKAGDTIVLAAPVRDRARPE